MIFSPPFSSNSLLTITTHQSSLPIASPQNPVSLPLLSSDQACCFLVQPLSIIIHSNMFQATTKRYSELRSQHATEPSIIHGLSAHSAPTETEQLMMRLLLISIELDRKDHIIRELLAAANSQDTSAIEEISRRCHHYEMEVKTLNETVTMLKENISAMQATKNKEFVFNSITQFNEELENKVYSLESKLRKTQEEKIELEQALKKHRLNQSMTEFQLMKNEKNEKGKVRELEAQLANERNKLENQRKITVEKSAVIEDLKAKIMEFELRERAAAQQFDERIRNIQQEFAFHQTMKKSQINSTEEKVSAHQNEIARLNEQIKFLRHNLEQSRETLSTRDKQVARLQAQHKSLQTKFIKQEMQMKEYSIKLQSRAQQSRHREKEVTQREGLIKKLQSEMQEFKFLFSTRGQELQRYVDEINKLKSELSDLYNLSDSQKMEIRKLKRRPVAQSVLCESCKIKENGSCSLIASQKSIKMFNFNEIIEQTEGLIRSNRRIESMITQRESGIDSSINLYRDHVYDI